jgi:mono/diheme cytochrome c family protein
MNLSFSLMRSRKTMLKATHLCPAVIGLFALLAICAHPVLGANPDELEKRILRLEQEITGAKQTEEIAMGREIYKAACMNCHGINGDGKGPSAKWLEPKPRDFTTGIYKWRTTPFGALPTDEDIERSIREGISGTEMVPFKEVLSKKGRMAVAQYIKTFSPKFLDPALRVPAKDILAVPETRPFERSVARIEKGRELYATKGCSACHGEEGAGDGPAAAALVDASGEPIEPWDFIRGFYKSGSTEQDLYRTISTGLNGTPMVAYAAATTEEERWQLVDFLRSIGVTHESLFHSLFVDEPTGRVYDPEHFSYGF